MCTDQKWNITFFNLDYNFRIRPKKSEKDQILDKWAMSAMLLEFQIQAGYHANEQIIK